MKNREWKWVFGSLVAAVVFAVTGIGATTAVDCFAGGCAITFLSVFLVITSLGTALLFFHCARTMDMILSGTQLLAHWTYAAEVTRKSVEREYAFYRESNRALFYLAGGMLLIAAVLAVILSNGNDLITPGILLFVILIIYIVSRMAPKLERSRALGAPKEAYIAKNGIIYEGAVYPFASFFMKMHMVKYYEGTEKMPPLLEFSFYQLVELIFRPFEISIPVPVDQEGKAREIALILGEG